MTTAPPRSRSRCRAPKTQAQMPQCPEAASPQQPPHSKHRPPDCTPVRQTHRRSAQASRYSPAQPSTPPPLSPPPRLRGTGEVIDVLPRSPLFADPRARSVLDEAMPTTALVTRSRPSHFERTFPLRVRCAQPRDSKRSRMAISVRGAGAGGAGLVGGVVAEEAAFADHFGYLWGHHVLPGGVTGFDAF